MIRCMKQRVFIGRCQTSKIGDIMKNKGIYYDIGSFVGLIGLIIAAFSYVLSIQNLLFTEAEYHLKEISNQFAQRVEGRLENNLDILTLLAQEDNCFSKLTYEGKLKKLFQWKEHSSFSQLAYVDSQGKGFSSDGKQIDISNSDLLSPVFEKEQYISKVILKYDGKYSNAIIFSSSIGNPETKKGSIFGVFELKSISGMEDSKLFNGEGEGYIIDKNGNIVLHSNSAYIGKNVFYEAAKHNSSVDIQKMKLKIASNASESVVYLSHKNIKEYAYFTPISVGDKDSNLVAVIVAPWKLVFEKSSKVIVQSIGLIAGICILYLLVMIYILHQKRENLKKLSIVAYQDELCSIYNRQGFNKYSAEFLEKSKRSLCAVDIDIDNFKVINSVFGYEFGDEVLKYMGSIIYELFNKRGVLGRINADRFCILISYKNKSRILRDIENLANQLNQKFYKYRDISISAGVYFVEDKSEGIDPIFDKTRLSNQSIKSMPKICYAIYQESMSLAVNEENWLVEEMKRAIENSDFSVYYQPKFDIATQKIVGSEALIRWKHSEAGYITPMKFIPLAEKTHLIIDIGRFVFRQVCEDIANWKARGIILKQVSINISRIELYQPDVLEYIEKILDLYEIESQCIQLEITETVALDEYKFIGEVLKRISDMGISMAIDDFGSGYSSLGCLQNFKVDALKLDRSFLENIDKSDKGINILRGMIELSNELGLDTVCEGIETRAQLEMLKEMKCKYGQGYLYAKPMPKIEYEKFLQG